MKLPVTMVVFLVGTVALVSAAKRNGSTKGYHATPYNFNYEIQGFNSSNQGRVEVRDKNGYISGSYHVLLPDGRHQYVTYKDNGNGFVVDVQYEGEAKTLDVYTTPASKRPVANKKPTYKGPSRWNTKTVPSVYKTETVTNPANKAPVQNVPSPYVADTKRVDQTKQSPESYRKSVPESYKRLATVAVSSAKTGSKKIANKERPSYATESYRRLNKASDNKEQGYSTESYPKSVAEVTSTKQPTSKSAPEYEQTSRDGGINFNPPAYTPVRAQSNNKLVSKSTKLANEEIVPIGTIKKTDHQNVSGLKSLPDISPRKIQPQEQKPIKEYIQQESRSVYENNPSTQVDKASPVNKPIINKVKDDKEPLAIPTTSAPDSYSKTRISIQPVDIAPKNQERVAVSDKSADKSSQQLEKEVSSSGNESESGLTSVSPSPKAAEDKITDSKAHVLTTPRYKTVTVSTTTPTYKVYRPPPYRVLDKSSQSTKGQIYKETSGRVILY